MTQNCGTCRHFTFTRQGSAEKVGECRRNAPAPITAIGPQQQASWPIVIESMGCGEWREVVAVSAKPKPPAKPKASPKARKTKTPAKA